MLFKKIPSSGEALPAVGIGTYKGFDLAETGANRKRLERVMEHLFAAGGTIVDSSPMYGRAEARTGAALRALGRTGDAFIMTKVWTSGREAGIRQMRESLRLLGAERIGLMQVHNLVDWRTQMDTLREWRAAGTFRYIGITHYTAGAFAEVETVLRQETMDFLQIPYSIAAREAEARLLPLCRERGVAVIANVPLGGGRLMGAVKGTPLPAWAAEFAGTWAQFFLKYLLAHPDCTCVIPGTGDPVHAADLLAAGEGRLPTEAERRRMAETVAAL